MRELKEFHPDIILKYYIEESDAAMVKGQRPESLHFFVYKGFKSGKDGVVSHWVFQALRQYLKEELKFIDVGSNNWVRFDPKDTFKIAIWKASFK